MFYSREHAALLLLPRKTVWLAGVAFYICYAGAVGLLGFKVGLVGRKVRLEGWKVGLVG